MRAPVGAQIWIYATSPRQEVVASAKLEAVVLDAPDEIWRTFGDRAGIGRREFDAYIGDAEVVAALCLTEITELDTPLCPRGEAAAFRPPQSYAFLHDVGLLAALEARSCGERTADETTTTRQSDQRTSRLPA